MSIKIPKAPRSASTIMYDHGAERGWGEDTEAGLFARFIDEKGLANELDEFLTKIGEEEDEMSKSPEDDEDE